MKWSVGMQHDSSRNLVGQAVGVVKRGASGSKESKRSFRNNGDDKKKNTKSEKYGREA